MQSSYKGLSVKRLTLVGFFLGGLPEGVPDEALTGILVELRSLHGRQQIIMHLFHAVHVLPDAVLTLQMVRWLSDFSKA